MTTGKRNDALLTLTAYFFFFLVGFFINIGGSVTNALARDLLAGTATIGYCFSAFMIGRFIGISGNGVFLKNPLIRKNLYIRLLPLISLLAVAALQATGSVWMLAASLFAAGIGIGGLYSSANMILVDIYSGPQKAFHISMINFLYSAGSICSPFLSGILLENGFSWNRPYLAFAAAIVISLMLTATADYGKLYAGQKSDVQDTGRMTPSLWMVCAAIVMYILAEFSITYWTPVYMREALGKSPLFAGACVSSFWTAVLIGRFSAGLLLRRIRPRPYILVSGLLSVCSLIALRLVSGDAAILAAVFFSGLFCSGLFPSIFILGTDMAEPLKRTFPTLMMLSAATGSFLAMPAGALIKSAAGIDYVLFIPVGALAVMYVLIVKSPCRRRISVLP